MSGPIGHLATAPAALAYRCRTLEEQHAAVDDTAAYAAALKRLAPIHLNDDCPKCDGTGEGRSEYERCGGCRGRCWVLKLRGSGVA